MAHRGGGGLTPLEALQKQERNFTEEVTEPENFFFLKLHNNDIKRHHAKWGATPYFLCQWINDIQGYPFKPYGLFNNKSESTHCPFFTHLLVWKIWVMVMSMGMLISPVCLNLYGWWDFT